MAEAEVNVISHLLSVEAEANNLVKEAQAEATKRLSAARAQADADFKKQFEKIVSSADKSCDEKIKSLSDNHNKTLEEYKSSVEKTEQDKSAFNALLKKVLIEE